MNERICDVPVNGNVTTAGHKRKLSEMSDGGAPSGGADNKALIFADSKDKLALSKEFAQEFHESVLKATREQEASRTGKLQVRCF